ncbi:hypothetical protein ABE424_10010 [Stenotrophomonas sp. TWI1149]|uniref:hypothetical protein n=1 Tax=unclassified Stenotrophomonas TaxID=196198 RepID=UPI00320A7C9B
MNSDRVRARPPLNGGAAALLLYGPNNDDGPTSSRAILVQVWAIGSCLFLFVLAALLAGALPFLILILLLLLTLAVPLLLTLLGLLVLLTLLILVAHVSSPLTASALMLRTRLAQPGLHVR